MLHSWADGEGGQKIESTGPLTRKRMDTFDSEVSEFAMKFIDDAHEVDEPFFLWWNTTGMHLRTHVAPEGKSNHKGKSNGQGNYADAMVAHDEYVGAMLDKLGEMGIANNTIVMYSTDNGVHLNTWPDAGVTPFRSEKNTNWEGGWRVPCFVRWPGHIPAGSVLNEIVSHQDFLPTLLAVAGEPEINKKLPDGHTAGDRTFSVHIDSQNLCSPILLARSPRVRVSTSSTSATTVTSWPSG